MKSYLANNLFCLGDRLVNELIVKKIREVIPKIDLYNPMENGDINNKELYASSTMIADADMEKLMESDFLIAVIDTLDEGVSAEIGAFYTTGKPIFGLFTDIRQFGRNNKQKIDALIEDGLECQFIYKNLFLVGLIKRNGMIYSDVDSMIDDIKKWSEE